MQVSFPNYANSIASYFGSALEQVGIKRIPGLLSGNLLGWEYTVLTVDPKEQTRSSSQSSYLVESLEQSPNLIVYKSTLAKKVLFNGTTAIGVEVDSGGVTYQIQAKKEVVVSAGAVSGKCKFVSVVTAQLTIYLVSFSTTLDGVRHWAQ